MRLTRNTEIFQRGQRPFAGLDLVQNDQRFAGNDLLVRRCLQIADDPLRGNAAVKIRCNGQVCFKIDIDYPV